MTLKKTSLQDSAAILFDIDNKAFSRPFDLPSRSIEEQAEFLKDSEVFIAYENDAPIGFIACETKVNVTEIRSIAVLPEWQGRGIGMQMVKNTLKSIKIPVVHLVTHPKNTNAIVMYLKCGFEIYGWKDNYYGDGQPRLLLVLQR